MTSSSENYERIWRTVADIPEGQVATYGQVADLAGLPRRARLVGTALNHSPDDLELPWHRVINAKGEISFPKGSEAYARQLDRLTEEGVAFVNGRIDLATFGWQPSLDELLWKPRD